MANMLATAAEYLRGVLASHTSRVVTYSRDSFSIQLVSTAELLTGYEYRDEFAAAGGLWRAEFFAAADLVLNGVLTAPQRGDLITEGGESWILLPVASGAIWVPWGPPAGGLLKTTWRRKL